ncbi:hypothetical protein QBC39DRAFT_327691 [Podospora conica]|nr:hypothetical protein QBC39DRAFT_327691 [Schizothecium conicum]
MTNDDEWHGEIAATHQQHTALSQRRPPGCWGPGRRYTAIWLRPRTLAAVQQTEGHRVGYLCIAIPGTSPAAGRTLTTTRRVDKKVLENATGQWTLLSCPVGNTSHRVLVIKRRSQLWSFAGREETVVAEPRIPILQRVQRPQGTCQQLPMLLCPRVSPGALLAIIGPVHVDLDTVVISTAAWYNDLMSRSTYTHSNVKPQASTRDGLHRDARKRQVGKTVTSLHPMIGHIAGLTPQSLPWMDKVPGHWCAVTGH